ncbi:hypothetical protein SOASR031_23240 [Leminorella grimontii]|nr:hypothetical protein SOASR031_23240 [Leminorella grimontii]
MPPTIPPTFIRLRVIDAVKPSASVIRVIEDEASILIVELSIASDALPPPEESMPNVEVVERSRDLMLTSEFSNER